MKKRNYSVLLMLVATMTLTLTACNKFDDVQEGDPDYFQRSKTFAEEVDGQVYWFIPESDGSSNVLVTWNRIGCNSIVDYVRTASTRYAGDVAVPATVTHNGVTYNVVGADDNAFYMCNGITSLVLQEGMTRWGEHTYFYSPFRTVMNKVKDIYLPSTLTDLRSIPDYYFMNNTALVSCHIPDVEAIGDSAFFKCSKLTTLNIPETVKTIGDGAFGNCSAIAEMTLPASVTAIGEDCFLSAKKLTTIHVKAMTPPAVKNAWALANKCNLLVPVGAKAAYEADEFWGTFKTITEE